MRIDGIRRIVAAHAPNVLAAAKLLRLAIDRKSFVHSEGLWQALKRDRPVDQFGRPVPWVNTSIRGLIEGRLMPDYRVLEFGSGGSTSFFQSRVREVVSIEHAAQWAEEVTRMVEANVSVVLTGSESAADYLNPTHDGALGRFDVVFVDGLFRNECCERSLRLVNERGVVVLDDSSRPEYLVSHEMFLDSGYKSLRVSGIKPCGIGADETTIFYRSVNCFDF